MEPNLAISQFRRLETRFGEKAFDKEFSRLAMREVSSVSNEEFVKVVDHLIGSRPASRPPTLDDFRQARLAIEKRKFEADIRGALKTFDGKMSFNSVKEYLHKTYGPGVNSLWEAVEIERIRIQAKRALEGET